MPLKKLTDYLESHQIRYEVIRHPEACTAQEIAASSHVPGKELAKTVMVKAEGRMAMAVLPASYRVDFHMLNEMIRLSFKDFRTLVKPRVHRFSYQ
jgi:Ala-tRNA(Pro) deacylase